MTQVYRSHMNVRRRSNLKVSSNMWSGYDQATIKQFNKTNVWIVERPFFWNRIDVGSRMTVIKLSDGSLWVHSPLDLDSQLKQEIDKIGPVKHIVSPNYEHVKFGSQWIEAYPQAKGYACPGLMQRMPRTNFAQEIGNTSPEEWMGEVDSVVLDYENNPFTGKPFFNEVVFVHGPSRALIVSDLYWNYPKDLTDGEWLWKQGMDYLYAPFYRNFMIKDREVYKSTIGRLYELDWDSIVPCHGDIVESNGKQVLKQHLQ
eukprot:TRINITY_DN6259_c0_g1_i1.p1 TRINITY_DN6259_c0_g1~~TRINITY_DN6259_c0_g1_i1.p1  ORF type:complete len:258 (+),score=19.31 TRINITY_DN6259_c0_g1_i1:125-898(+)